jgi:aminoglycoside phosphotransferase (APT) family kinase protein
MSDALTALQRKIETFLAGQTEGDVVVRDLQPLGGGACQDNYRVELSLSAGELQGERRMVLRSDAKALLAASLSRRQEFEVVRAAVAAGVRTPQVHWLTEGLIREGASAYFMDWVEGDAIGRRVVRNPELARAREKLPEELARQLARIHSVTPAAAPHLTRLGVTHMVPSGGLSAQQAVVVFNRKLLDSLPEPHPALELCLHWLEEHAPPPVPLTLVHGDFRTGNFMVTPEGLSAVLDWEFAHFGDPMEDLGWLCVRDWRFSQLALPVGGFARREALYTAYEEAAGHPVDPARVHYWEVAGNVKWAVGSVLQGERYLSGQETDLELVAIARRAVEMEFEALRLIEQGV